MPKPRKVAPKDARRDARRGSPGGAEILVATAELRVVTVNKKTFPMSAFRQLQDVPIVDPETGVLSGEPWGWVNYVRHTDGTWFSTTAPENGLNAVWVVRGSLARSQIRRPKGHDDIPGCKTLRMAKFAAGDSLQTLTRIGAALAIHEGAPFESWPGKAPVLDPGGRPATDGFGKPLTRATVHLKTDGPGGWHAEVPEYGAACWTNSPSDELARCLAAVGCGVRPGANCGDRREADHYRKQLLAVATRVREATAPGRPFTLAAVASERDSAITVIRQKSRAAEAVWDQYQASFAAVLASGQLFIAT